MTRETKIGLLVGLGFIVVFAILLSQSNPATSPAGGLPPVAASGSGRLSDPGTGMPAGRAAPWVAPGESSGPANGIGAAPSSAPEALAAGGNSEELPDPAGLRPEPIAGLVRADLPDDGGNPSDEAIRSEVAAAVKRRVAPDAIRDPEPTRPADPPTLSENPDQLAQADPREGTAGRLAAQPTTPAKEHLVQKGETLGQIASQYYQTSKPRVVQFIVESNKSKIRNADVVIEGQKLMIPELPADMFEPVASLDHGSIRSGTSAAPANPNPAGRRLPGGAQQPGTGTARTPERPTTPERSAPPPQAPRTSDESLGVALAGNPERAATGVQSPPRKAPRTASEGALTVDQPRKAPDKPRTEVAVAEGFRIYEIQPKDTPSAIARRQLGSEQQWREIIRMNPGLDPMKMRPGAQIKLPRKASQAPSGEKKRGAA